LDSVAQMSGRIYGSCLMKLYIIRTQSPNFTAALLVRASGEARVIEVAKDYAFGQNGLPPGDFPTNVKIEEVQATGQEAVLLAVL
jgi:hypothetical protein